MKRKRGHKKGKQKQSSAPKPPTKNEEIDSPVKDLDSDNAKLDSPMEVEAAAAAAPLGLNQPPNPTNAESDGLVESRPGRVKVKLKSSSKNLEPKNAQLEEQSQGDAEKSNSHRERQAEVEKVGDGAKPVPTREPIVFHRLSKKAGSIKIKSWNGASQMKVQGEETIQTVSDGRKGLEASKPQESQQKEVKSIQQDPRYNGQELKASLGVIKKVMKMDAAEPFNIPVNPVDLGIPDYFDIIENPMDFGTICNNIESGNVYMNSEDVFRDVQYIWDNCYRYNNKGDYILDLMKRVKKNFTKYWTAAGLYNDQQNKVNGTESAQVETIVSSSKQKFHVKGIKHKSRRRHGINRHKSDCQCAVCVVRRRRKEREEVAPFFENQIETSDGNLTQEFRLEETFLENASSEDESSKLEHSPEPDAVVDLEGKEVELKPHGPEQCDSHVHEKQETSVSGEIQNDMRQGNLKQSQDTDKSIDEPNALSRSDEMEDLGDTETNGLSFEQKQDARETHELERKIHASQDKQRKMELRKSLRFEENHLVMELCKTLFPNDCKNGWTGPHSLVNSCMTPRKNSAMKAAMDMFMQ